MSIGIGEIDRIIHLARIQASEEEKSALAEDLSRILDWAEQIHSVPTDSVSLSSFVPSHGVPPREDKITEPDNNDEAILSNAPEASYGFFIVPRVLE